MQRRALLASFKASFGRKRLEHSPSESPEPAKSKLNTVMLKGNKTGKVLRASKRLLQLPCKYTTHGSRSAARSAAIGSKWLHLRPAPLF